MTKDYAVRAGGWDPRYAVARGVVSDEDFAVALIDPNGDGGTIDLDEYSRGPDGGWMAESSGGGAGDSGTSWSQHLVATYGRTEPGARVLVDYCGRTYPVTADEDGWWLWAQRSLDDHTMPGSRSDD